MLGVRFCLYILVDYGLFMRKNTLKILLCLLPALFCSGCGIISILGTPSASEEVVEAKYDVSSRYEEKILVIVNQPSWVNSPINLRKELTNKINSYMRIYFEGMPEESIIEYDDVKSKRSRDLNFDDKDAVELGEIFDAGLIIYVEVLEFDFSRLTAGDYYSAEMKTFTVLYDGVTGDALWPKTKVDSVVSVELECEKTVGGTMTRLATANAHCILRNFYDCKRQKYRVMEEKKQFDNEQW